MKLLFSEARPDYGHYVFPYAVWAFPESGETAGDLFARGFLPSSRNLDRFYLCRNVRVDLRRFVPSSENRRVLRKGGGIEPVLLPRSEFVYDAERRAFCKAYADRRFGSEVMTWERLDGLFASRITSHVLVFRDVEQGREVGVVTLYLEPPAVAYYYNAFYDLGLSGRNLGLYMMTSALRLLSGLGYGHAYLGSCYTASAMYKTQFAGVEFFNGYRWSANLEELKYLIRRQSEDPSGHLLESEQYRREFAGAGPVELAGASEFGSRVDPGIGLDRSSE